MAGRILFYIQHLLGIGHLARASRIATALIERGAEVTLVTGGMPVSGFPPPGVPHVALPPLRSASEGFKGFADGSGAEASPAYLAARRDLLLQTFRDLRPDVVVTEAFPFGRRQMRFELLPLIAALEAATPRPRLVASVRDIVQEKTKAERDRETVEMIRAHYDLVLVHGDPAFAALKDSFPLADDIADKIRHTGLVVPPAPEPAKDGVDVVISAGGGAVGAALSRAALGALARLSGRLSVCLITGPNLPEPVRADLAASAASLPQHDLRLETFYPGLARLLAASKLSISQAGYNTVGDILQAGCRSILVPYAAGDETEQTRRAERLERIGRAYVIAETRLDAESLAGAITAALATPRPAPGGGGLALDGATRSAELLCAVAEGG
ncbi:glycosyltransferase family protein [Rhodobacter maris]|uniref:Predicted glycosyltransferase n=1 Tax=Rhodobacter maris TaxID=446682 RepID=A0A285T9P6_9RHOB|nr:glycosyltransferase [Rhodobacter maris]SOC18289.1 predicted glycosyltransferase [Rhodobacter maris]